MPLRSERLPALIAWLALPVAIVVQPAIGADKQAPPLDEVGYAGVDASLEGVSASYGATAAPGHVEVTALSSGRTILVRVVPRAAGATDRLANLSCDAIRQLGAPSRELIAVRVRQYNPSAQDMGALKAGGEAAARLPTPESLLAVLRQKLPAAPTSKAATDGDPCGGPADPPTAKPMASAPAKAPSPRPVTAQPSPPTSAGDFIVEEPRERRSRQATAAATGRFAVQAVAVSSRAQADSLARRIDGFVEPAGRLFRVRKGPYPDAASARSALQAVRAKGFAEACVVTIGGR